MLKDLLTIIPDHIVIAKEMADGIYKYPSDHHKEMVAKIKDRLIELHENEITKINGA